MSETQNTNPPIDPPQPKPEKEKKYRVTLLKLDQEVNEKGEKAGPKMYLPNPDGESRVRTRSGVEQLVKNGVQSLHPAIADALVNEISLRSYFKVEEVN